MALLLVTSCSASFAQSPVITPGGVVNAASYTQPVVPGSLVAIFGSNLAQGVSVATTTPWPTTLNGTSVSFNGIAAPLSYVSPIQINAQVPSSLTFNGGVTNTMASVVVTTTVGSSAPAALALFWSAPGVFTTDGSGCGQAAALNIAADGSFSPNSPSNSAAPGDFLAVFGTGFAETYSPPSDGAPAPTAQPLELTGGVAIDGKTLLAAGYFGLAPDLVGVDQANVQIPADMRDGCAVPLAVAGGSLLMSPTVTVSIHSSRGQCVDPPSQSYGTISLVRTVATGTSQDGETDTLTASFPSGPQLTRPAAQNQTPTNGYAISEQPAGPTRACPVAGYDQLSAGPVVISGPKGSATAAPTTAVGSPAYSQNLPAGFVTGGAYNISAAGGPAIGPFQVSMTLDSPIQITATQIPANLSSGQPITLQWTGGAATGDVKVSLVYKSFLGDYAAYGYTPASAGSFTFQPICIGNAVPAGNGVICSFGIPGATELIVDQMPVTNQVSTFQTPGITSDVQASWLYRYIFGINPQ